MLRLESIMLKNLDNVFAMGYLKLWNQCADHMNGDFSDIDTDQRVNEVFLFGYCVLQ